MTATTAVTAEAREAARQQALMQALWQPLAASGHDPAGEALQPWLRPQAPPPGQAPEAPGPQAPSSAGLLVARGLAAYRGHARALATRALAAAYPTVAALVGDDTFALLARRHWLDQPPRQGELGQWGEGLPLALAGDAQLADCPYLADVARLDWAVHRAAQAPDGPAAVADLGLLATLDPAEWTLALRPGTAVWPSTWPIVALWQAHQGLAAGAEPDLRAARRALAAGHGDIASVWRPLGGWRVQVVAVGPADAALEQALLAGAPLDQALDQALATAAAAQPDWTFDAWLIQALQQGRLSAVVRLPSAEGEPR